jgi:phosphatidylglycerol:prolipoprotein diacylglycerol transferase
VSPGTLFFILCGQLQPGENVESQFFIHNFDPIIFEFGLFGMHLRVAWYGLMYVIGFIAGYYLVKYLWRQGFIEFPDNNSLADLMTYMFVGVIIGGRLGHVLFYDPIAYFSDPVTILFVWEGGMASHGGMIGVVIATYLYARRYHVSLRIACGMLWRWPPQLDSVWAVLVTLSMVKWSARSLMSAGP